MPWVPEQTQLNEDQIEECRQNFNRMVDAYQLDGQTIYYIARLIFDLVPGQGDYTVGIGGDFDPGCYLVRIERASVLITTNPQPVANSGPPEYKLWPFTVDDYQEWIYKKQTTNFPRYYYYDENYPLGGLHLMWVPLDPDQIVIYAEQPLLAIDATADELLDFRPGYQDFLQSNLAVRLSDSNPRAQLKPGVLERARSSENLVKMANNRPLKRMSDFAQGPYRNNVYMGNRYNTR